MAQVAERFPPQVDHAAYDGEPLAVSAGVIDPEQEMEPQGDEHDEEGTHSPPYDQVCSLLLRCRRSSCAAMSCSRSDPGVTLPGCATDRPTYAPSVCACAERRGAISDCLMCFPILTLAGNAMTAKSKFSSFD